MTCQSHDYKRHGTTTLFAALEVAIVKIIATHLKRRRRVDFLDLCTENLIRVDNVTEHGRQLKKGVYTAPSKEKHSIQCMNAGAISSRSLN